MEIVENIKRINAYDVFYAAIPEAQELYRLYWCANNPVPENEYPYKGTRNYLLKENCEMFGLPVYYANIYANIMRRAIKDAGLAKLAINRTVSYLPSDDLDDFVAALKARHYEVVKEGCGIGTHLLIIWRPVWNE